MELANYFDIQFSVEDISFKKVLKDFGNEITNAILSAKTNKAFDKDVCLSLGVIHINPYESVSEISFNGIDVTTVD